MSVARVLWFASLAACLLLLGLPFAFMASGFGLGLVGVAALLWGWQLFRPGPRVGALALAGTLVAAALVILMNPPFAPVAFLSAGAALAAWDLSSFLERIRGASPAPEEYRRMERVHFRKLFGTCLVGLVIGGLVFTIRLNIPFAGAALAAAVWFVGLAAFLRLIRRQNPE